MEFINSAPCPVSIDRESFFRVNLKYGEVIIMRLCFVLALGEKNMDDVSYRKMFVSIIDKQIRVAVHMLNDRALMMSKCGKNKIVAYETQLSASLTFLPHFYVFYDLLLDRRKVTQNLPVNPLHPNISMYILHTVLHSFPKRLTRRICVTIKGCFSW